MRNTNKELKSEKLFITDDMINKAIKESISKFITHSNCFGIPRGLAEYKRPEYEGILIVEERSVAAYTYRKAISIISTIIDNKIKQQQFDNFPFNINEIDGINIEWSEEFIVYIVFTSNEETAEYLDKYTIVEDGKGKRVVIAVYVNPYHHNDSLIHQFLYHEFNHCKDDIERRINGKQTLSVSLNTKINYQQAYNALSNNHNDYIAYIIYNLFADTEINASISQFYGELEKKPSKRQDFHNILKHTDAYRKYDGFNYIIETLEKQQGWEEYAMSFFPSNKYDTNTFRKWFINHAKQQIQKYWTKIGKVASLYYDTMEA